MRVRLWFAFVLGVLTLGSVLGATGCAGLLGDFTTEDEAGDGGLDGSIVLDASGADGTVVADAVALNDAAPSDDGTVSDAGGDAAPVEDSAFPIDANDAGGCGSGTKLCDFECRQVGDPGYGCSLSTCTPCPIEHDVPTCTAGACAIESCTTGYNDCNGSAADGCETSGKCPCTPTSCPNGCCDATGTCQTSGMTTCGTGGVKCAACVAGQTCTTAGVCSCAPGCAGCCQNDVCVAESDTTCGSGGASCISCSIGTSCGMASNNAYQCLCNSATCATGCCQATPGGGAQAAACVTTETAAACGVSGKVCSTCGSGLACDGAKGDCTCTAASCPNGCCTTDGSGNAVCEAQSAQGPSSCGIHGATCASCSGANTCTAGACSCPSTATTCSGVCTNVLTDPANCGICGHSCQDEACSGGLCVQVTLGSGTGSGEGIAVWPKAAYYSLSEGTNPTGSVQQIALPPLAGCGSACSTPLISGLTGPGAVALGGPTTAPPIVYVANTTTGTISMFAAGITAIVATGAGPQGYGSGVTADSGHVYYGNTGGGITSCPAGDTCTGTSPTGTAVVVAPPGAVFGAYLAVDDSTAVYASDFQQHIYRCTLPACDVGAGLTTLVSTGKATTYLFVDATSIFWIDRETTNLTNCDGHVSRSKKTDGTLITAYTTTACYPQGIRADAQNVYWGSTDGIYRCPIAGCPTGGPTKIGSSAGEVDWVDQDPSFVYWVDYAGVAYRVAK